MPTFSLQLQKLIQPGYVVSGKFDGSHACLAAATPSGNILVHSPHRQPASNIEVEQSQGKLAWSGELAKLQIGKQVTALCTGHFGEDERDVLLVGTATHVLAYLIEDNADLFYKEMRDGVHSAVIGKLGWLSSQVAVIGGNCSVTVLDSQGTEIYWTVMGDLVTSVMVFDFDGDGCNELLAGTEDFEVRAQKEDSVLWEMKETAPVTALTPLPNRQFAYAVRNGTVGVYESNQRLWRVKSKHRVVAIRGFDVNGDGIAELVTGWSSGKVDARTAKTGDVIFRIQLNAGIAGVIDADYRRTGRSDLVILSATGELRGYASGSAVDTLEAGEIKRDLMLKKQALQLELQQRASITYQDSRLIIDISSSRGAVRLNFASGPGLLVYCAIVFAEGVFEGETLVSHPSKPRGELEIELKPPNNGPIDIHVKACVGPPGTDVFQVFEQTRQLPRFCMYEVTGHPENFSEDIQGYGVIADVAERAQRIILWLNQCFLLSEELEIPEEGPNAGSIELWLRGFRDNKIHCFRSTPTGKINIETEDAAFAGDIIQSLATYLGLRELSSEAKFPTEEQRMTEALERVKGLKEVESKLQAEVAGGLTQLKDLVIRLEDARILEDVENMKKRLVQLRSVNGDLIREHEIRMKSHGEFTAALKELNVGVQRASRLRVGRAAANAVSRCRSAIHAENPKALILAIRHG